MAVLASPLYLARSPPYMPPPRVAACLSDTHLIASGPSELAGLIGWLTGGDGTSTRRNTRAMMLQDATNTVASSIGASWTLRCATRFNLGDRHWQCPQRNYRLRSKCREQLYAHKPFEANCSKAKGDWRSGTRLNVSFYWRSYQYSQTPEVSLDVGEL